MRFLPNFFVFLFFLVFLCIGLICYNDYGLSFDEEFERLTGLVTLKYLLQLFYPQGLDSIININNIPTLEKYYDRIYSPHFQLVCLFLKRLFKIRGTQETYLFTHLINFLVFYIGVIFFYKILKQETQNWRISLFGAALLVLSPRIFADAFYNSKDIIFLSACIFCFYTFIKLFNAKDFKYLALHAFASALATDIRFMGLIFPVLTIAFIFLEKLRNKDSLSFRQACLISITYLFLVVAFIYLLWPYLWENPIHNFLAIFNKLNRNGEVGYNLFNGELIPFNQLPWYYIPEWIIISTPFLYSCFFVLGNALILKDALSGKINRRDLLIIILFYSPILAVIWTNAILYDGWRHLFFIYPFFLIIVVKGAVQFHDFLRIKMEYLGNKISAFYWGGIVVYLGMIIHFMIVNHPHQNVYFNKLVNKEGIQRKFELDYWGLSYRQALEFLLMHDKNATINFNASSAAGGLNIEILDETQRKRVKLVPLEQATYFLTDYRWHPQPYPYQEIYAIKVDGFKIMSVFKLK